MKKILIFAFLLLLIAEISCKTTSHTITQASLKKSGWKYLTKFSMTFGTGNYVIRVRLENVPTSMKNKDENLTLHFPVYRDTNFNYDEIQSVENSKKSELAWFQNKIQIPLSGDETVHQGQTLQVVKRRVYYFAICDAENALKNLQVYGLKIRVDIDIINADGSHFSNDEEGFIWIYSFLSILGVGFLFVNIKKIQQYQRKTQERDWAHLLVILALTFFTISYILYLIHLLNYQSNGEGLRPVELFSQIFNVAGECVITIFLLLISWGWTINYTELEDLEVYVPLSILVVIVHIIIIGLGKLSDDAYDKFHPYDGWVGLVIIIIRIGLYAYFFFGIKESFNRARPKVKEFAQQLIVMGSTYFLAFPFIVIFSYVFDTYMRLSVVYFGSALIQIIAVVTLSYVLTSKKSGYYSISTKGQTLLPTDKVD